MAAHRAARCPLRAPAASARPGFGGACALLTLAASLAALAGPAAAQSVSPVIAEYDGAVTGRFQVSNPTLHPLTVVVEGQGFDLDEEGRPAFGPLPSGLRLRLSETSFQVPPRGSRTVYYEIEADRLPAWFTIYSTVVGIRSAGGMNVRVQLPHTVYVYAKPLDRDDVEVADVRFDPGRARIDLTVHNAGSRLGRVGSVEVGGPGGKADAAGFPLLPGRTRRISVPWVHAEPPTGLTLHAGHFDVEIELPDRSHGPG